MSLSFYVTLIHVELISV